VTTEPSSNASRQLDAYLDGELAPEANAAFEKRLEEDAQLRRAMECQRHVDAALRRLFQGPPSAHLEWRILDLVRRPDLWAAKTKTLVVSRRLALAAMLALAVTSAWFNRDRIWRSPGPRVYERHPWRPLADAYRFEVERGMKPDWVCRNDSEFTDIFRRRLGQSLLLATAPPGVTAGGICYRDTITRKTVAVLGRAREQPVMVFVDRLEADSHPSLPPESGLHLFRAEVGRLVLYEVSPLSKPHLLSLFYDPDTPAP
jgi:hypothetical protein